MADNSPWIAVAIACVGVAGTLGGAILGHQGGAMSVNKDYVQIAMDNLNNRNTIPALRKWSIDVLNELSPVPMDRSLKEQLLVPAVMGPLEMETNRQGNDFDAFGRGAENAQLCAEMCRIDEDCDAMTYVVSLKTCWMKRGVPSARKHPDMISAVKVVTNQGEPAPESKN